LACLVPRVWCSGFGRLKRFGTTIKIRGIRGQGTALCARIRDEAPNLLEWIEYHKAAGVDHFFFYESFSSDNYLEMLDPYIERGIVSLQNNWPHVPVSPAAEEHCLIACMGRYEWVGFLDVDEFVVVKDGSSISEFLRSFPSAAAVALHWRVFGSGGRTLRSEFPSIRSYTLRAADTNPHVKCFVRPECVVQNRNPHSFYYRGCRRAVTENGRPVSGSLSSPATSERAWLNHYHFKSREEYLVKGSRVCFAESAGMKMTARPIDRVEEAMQLNNEVSDESAIQYYLTRCRAMSISPVL
jgi:hypothetical protein